MDEEKFKKFHDKLKHSWFYKTTGRHHTNSKDRKGVIICASQLTKEGLWSLICLSYLLISVMTESRLYDALFAPYLYSVL